MSRKTKQDWLEAAIQLLSSDGAQVLTIERLTQTLQVTKGSFYHHFGNWAGFKAALLAYFEEESTHNVIILTEEATRTVDKVQRLLDATLSYPPNTEVAMRAWALQDAEVREMQARIDEQRIAYVEGLMLETGEKPEQARVISRMLYSIFIGGQQIIPSYGEGLMTELYDEIRRVYGLRAKKASD